MTRQLGRRGSMAGMAGPRWDLGAWETAPILLDAIAADGTVLACNAAEAAALGCTAGDVIGQPMARFYLRGSAERLQELSRFLEPDAVRRHVRLDLRRCDGRPLGVSASIDTIDCDGERVLRVVKMPLDPALDRNDQLARENETLRSIVSTSRDALWCIEFAEPVDLTAPPGEVVRQVFENVSYWRLCNKAMARLYKLPENLDFNEQHVRVAFPRNPENETFVQRLIEHDFNIDGAPSLDRRYDGLDVHIENDVRGHIENGMLRRMWGAARDLSEHKRKELDLANQLEATIEVLSAVPDPILVIGQEGVLEAANPAVEWRFGWPIDEVLGRTAAALIRFPAGVQLTTDGMEPGAAGQVFDVVVRGADGREHECRGHLTALSGRARGRRMVLTLAPESGGVPQTWRRRAGPAG